MSIGTEILKLAEGKASVVGERQMVRVVKGNPNTLGAKLFKTAMEFMKDVAMEIKKKARKDWAFKQPTEDTNLGQVRLEFDGKKRDDFIVGGGIALTWHQDRGVSVSIRMDNKKDSGKMDERGWTFDSSEKIRDMAVSVLQSMSENYGYVAGHHD